MINLFLKELRESIQTTSSTKISSLNSQFTSQVWGSSILDIAFFVAMAFLIIAPHVLTYRTVMEILTSLPPDALRKNSLLINFLAD